MMLNQKLPQEEFVSEAHSTTLMPPPPKNHIIAIVAEYNTLSYM